MADLADQIDDYICTFEGVGDLTMDTLAMLIFVWAVAALFLVWLCKFLYTKYVKKGDAAGGALDTSKIGTSPSEKLRKSEPKELSASKDIKGLDLAAKPLGKASGGAAFKSGARGGASLDFPQVQTRKRLSRKSPGPELRKPIRSAPPPSNVVGPEASSVTWTSQVFRWLYSDMVIVNELLHSWVLQINEETKKVVESAGVAVEVVRVLPESPAPNLTNIFCQSAETSPSEMVISLDCDATPVLQVKTYRQKSGKVETAHYKATISRLRARLITSMSYNSLKGDTRVEGFPDVKIALNSIGAIKTMDQDETQLQEVIIEILTNAIQNTLYPVDFSIYSTCPRAVDPEQPEIPVNFPTHYDSLAYNMDHLNPTHPYIGAPVNAVPSGKRLLVKVVKGEGLQTANDPYCVIEMDEPPQKNQTGARAGKAPLWDEHFLFDLTPQSAEILFEIYDRPANAGDPPKFLGLGLVGIDELAVGPASSQILALQPRPYETENVSGAITVEFVFIEGAEVPVGRRPYKFKEALKITNSAQLNGLGYTNGEDLANTAIKALEGGALSTANGNPSKSTLIIHSVQRVHLNPAGQIELDETPTVDATSSFEQTTSVADDETRLDDEDCSTVAVPTDADALLQADDEPNVSAVDDVHESLATAPADEDPSTVEADAEAITVKQVEPIEATPPPANEQLDETFASAADESLLANGQIPNGSANGDAIGDETKYEDFEQPGESVAQSSPIGPTINGNNHLSATLPATNGTNGENGHAADADDTERGRTRKKRDFFGTLKRKLGRSKSRAKSVDRGMIPIDAQNPSATTNSAEVRSVSADRGALASNSSAGRRLVVPTLDQSRRSSLSESSAISGFSSVSTKTYTHEASTLVLETVENGVKRHFLVPLSVAQRPRWRRKGTKLHIYNDHTFVAKHLSGGLLCDVCNRSIPRRPGKQGYECRDCVMKCHKQCHVRVPQACSNPTVLSMELSKLNAAAAERIIRKP